MYNQSAFLVIKIAYMYYIENYSQNEIAKALQISVTTVSRMLKKAKQERIVEFVIRDPYVECISLEKELKETFGLKDVIIAPGLAVEAADIIKQEKNNKKVFQMFDNINISINGTGSFYPELNSVLAKPEFMSKEELGWLQEQSVVGDIALRFFDKDGKECKTELADRMITIGFEQFKKIDTKITIASGGYKAQTVLSALKGKLIDVLIIDYQLGRRIMELYRTEAEK